ncbi:3-isopropylmalate dehydratase large subunit [Sporohalobacter salinus]|uniref:3-isopropylmalate dehydratase large subunit n=1 Tax=Sporohalobacter salinus TaxID=1494606 RepID=UPI0019621733|nr:3-isopropylmalate dehydratase large subunit [Sporohalobacter salinus]MBM7624028.1 3-isopropylmalate/(R)-2-methylmalate dehydratase large subunit [Sporohalobacter salinus]
MGMTMVEKILADHANREEVQAGELINAKLDIVLGNDVTTPVAINEFNKIGVDEVFDKERVVIVPDHFVPNKDINSAEQCKFTREFAAEKELVNYFEIGEMGIEHCLLPEQGLVLPGDTVIGADSHTCTYGALGAFATGVGSTDMAAGMATGEAWFKVPETIKFVYQGELNDWVGGKDLILYTIGDIGVDGALYKAMEFSGEVIENLPMDHRFTMSNMAIEAGGKCGLIKPDQTTIDYVEDRAQRDYKLYQSDEDAEYEQVIEYDVSKIEPQVAFPHLPENTRGISEVGNVGIDQAVIGSCTNGRLDDLRLAAEVLEGKKADDSVRLIIFPGTQEIYKQAMKEGLIEIFIDAGAAVSTPTCGPCLGGHMGVLAAGERAIATTNRNFVGRMGHPESEVYLSNPAVAAASAIKGKIVSPKEVI